MSHSQELTQAMLEDVKRGDSSIIAYRNYYIFYKYKMAKWTKRRILQIGGNGGV